MADREISPRRAQQAPAIPEELLRTLPAWFGQPAAIWLSELPAIALRLAESWQLTLGAAYGGGTQALVLAVTRGTDDHFVLKIPFVYEGNRLEAAGLRHFAGRGAVQLIDFDVESGALLLEQLEPGAPLADCSDKEQIVTSACKLLWRLWRPLEGPHAFRTVQDLALEWREEIATYQPLKPDVVPRPVTEEALELLSALAAPRAAEVLSNGDFHLGNVLSAEREAWLLIDPKPLAGERAFDAAALLFDRLNEPITAGGAAELTLHLVRELSVERQRVRAWALARSVREALRCSMLSEAAGCYVAKATALAAI